MSVSIKIECGCVLLRADDNHLQNLGTIEPNEEQLIRVMKRIFEAGRQDKARELRKTLGME